MRAADAQQSAGTALSKLCSAGPPRQSTARAVPTGKWRVKEPQPEASKEVLSVDPRNG